MRKSIFTVIVILLTTVSIQVSGQKPNKLTGKEKKAGWVLLFNGRDFTGWRQCNGTEMPKNWIIEDNAMKIFTAPDKKPGQGSNGDIIYAPKKFRNFELSVDWKTSKMGNSGIFFNIMTGIDTRNGGSKYVYADSGKNIWEMHKER